MPFQLAPMLEEDIPAFAMADERAMVDYAFARAMETPGVPRHVMGEALTRKDWGKDPNHSWMKVTDSLTGELAAASLWVFTLERKAEPPPAVPEADQAAPQGKDEGAQMAPPVESLSAVEPVAAKKDLASLFQKTRSQNQAFKEKYIGDDPYAELAILITDPKYQRQGCGSMLVKWGCDKADEHGLPSILQASPAGYTVYTKFGFEIKSSIDFDLRPWGIDEVTQRRHMYRPAKTC